MFLKYRTFYKRNTFALLRNLSICFMWICLCATVQSQSLEKKTDEVKLAETGITVTQEDVENDRIKAEELKTIQGKSINEIELVISNLENDAETTTIYLDGLQRNKKAFQTDETNPKFLELLDKELKVVKQKIDVDNELIQAYKDQIAALQNQSKVYADRTILLSSVIKLAETLAVRSSEQAATTRKEADVAMGYVRAVQANLKEKGGRIKKETGRVGSSKKRRGVNAESCRGYEGRSRKDHTGNSQENRGNRTGTNGNDLSGKKEGVGTGGRGTKTAWTNCKKEGRTYYHRRATI